MQTMSYLVNCYYDIGLRVGPNVLSVSSVIPLRYVTFGNICYSIAHLYAMHTHMPISLVM